MKNVILAAILLVTSAYAQTATRHAAAPSSKTEQELIGLNRELIAALERGDKSVAERIYADQFVRVTTQGEVLTKAQVLASLKAPAAGVKVSYDSENIQVFDYGDAAVMVYLSIRHTDNKGEKTDFHYRVTDTFVKRDGRWRKAASVGTPLTAASGR